MGFLVLLRDLEKIRAVAAETPKYRTPLFIKAPLVALERHIIQIHPYSLINYFVIHNFHFY